MGFTSPFEINQKGQYKNESNLLSPIPYIDDKRSEKPSYSVIPKSANKSLVNYSANHNTETAKFKHENKQIDTN